jgi:uncharacterized protein (UPF0335 family)
MKGHNEMTEEEQYAQQVFMKAMREVRDGKSEIAGIMGDLADVYAQAKHKGFTKADIKWALSLDTKDSAEVIQEMERRLKIAKWLGHGLARQVEMFPDRTPVDERAYEMGLAAGKLRKPNQNPYDPGSAPGQQWQKGMNDGTEFINKDLEKIISSRQEDPFPDVVPEDEATAEEAPAKAPPKPPRLVKGGKKDETEAA